MNTTNEIHYLDPAQVNLGDYAWRTGHRTADDAKRSLETELECYRARYIAEENNKVYEAERVIGSALLAVS